MAWTTAAKVEDILKIDHDTLVRDHKDVFLFLLGEHTKRLSRLETLAQRVRDFIKCAEGGSITKITSCCAYRQMGKALYDFERADTQLKTHRKKRTRRSSQ